MKLSCASLQNAAGRLISVKVAVQLPTDSKINKLSFVLYLKTTFEAIILSLFSTYTVYL